MWGYELLQTNEGRIVFIALVVITICLMIWDKAFRKK